MRRRDFRVICDCQRHAPRRRFWRSSLSAAQSVTHQLRRGGVAVLVGVPLAFGAIGIPTEAMITGPSGAGVRVEALAAQTFQIFTTRSVKRQFMTPPRREPRRLTVEVSKEAFFRTNVPYGSIIYREARRNALAPELVAAVVEAESDFRVRLVSEKNAQGLMQIVPTTGRLLGARDLFDPDDNITAGTRYLRQLIDRFRDPRLALAAYNAGEGNVEKWGGVPPFPETTAYLQRVDERARAYRSRIRQTYLASVRQESATLR